MTGKTSTEPTPAPDLCGATRQVGTTTMTCVRPPHDEAPANHSFAAVDPTNLPPGVPPPALLAAFLDMAYLHPADHEHGEPDMVLECNYCSEPPNDYYVGPAYGLTDEDRLAFAAHVVRCHADELVRGWNA